MKGKGRPGGRSRSGSGPRVRTPAPAGGSLGGEQVEGRWAVRELLAAGTRQALEVWVSEDASPAPVLDEIDELAARRGVPLRRVNRAQLDARAATGAPQGVLARARPLPEADLDRLCGRPQDVDRPEPFLLFLEGVTDPQNLGAVLRTAEGAGATGAVLPRHRAVRVTPAVVKAAAGAVERVPLAVVAGIPAALARARELGVWTVGLVTDGDHSLFELPVADQPIAMVLGAEDRGLSRLARQRCDVLAAIPLRGALPSLNVAAAGAIALFEVTRRRSGHAPGPGADSPRPG